MCVHEVSVKGQYHTHISQSAEQGFIEISKRLILKVAAKALGYRKFPLDVAPVALRSRETEVMSALDSLLLYSPLSRVTVTVNLSSAPRCARPQPATTSPCLPCHHGNRNQLCGMHIHACTHTHTNTLWCLKSKNKDSELQFT